MLRHASSPEVAPDVPRDRDEPFRLVPGQLLDGLPDLERAVPTAERHLARRALAVPAVTCPAGPIALDGSSAVTRPFAWVILEGLVLRNTDARGRTATEVLGPGDILGTDSEDDAPATQVRTTLAAHRPATLAVLDDRFRLAARRWPRMHDVVYAALAAQTRRTSRTLAVLALSRVDERLIAVFEDLAARWGRVTPEGVALDIEMTHHLLGQLVGARRPTVSLALAELAAAGRLTRLDDGTWRLPVTGAEAL